VAAPISVEEYLAALPKESRVALEKLRKRIRAAAPEAIETISYQMPAFKDHGRFLVSYAAFKEHLQPLPGERGCHRGTRGRAAALLLGKGNDPLHPGQAPPRQAREEDRQDPARGERSTQAPVVKPARGITQANAAPDSYMVRVATQAVVAQTQRGRCHGPGA
jgi:hypothetical protein